MQLLQFSFFYFFEAERRNDFCNKKEIFLRKDELENKTLSSLYFGGGTPSILSVDEIKSLIDEVLKYFDFDKNIEITLEANPDDLDKNFLKDLAKTEINRLSIGTQSFLKKI
jgi:oxygen-independent coproporphyrinogen-3 oxidase